ncbi:MAG: NnrS family protein [bacterium]
MNRSSHPDMHRLAIFDLGFRPFFLGAATFAVVSISAWLGGYFGWLSLNWTSISSFQWHAHEMIFGYCMAVIAGFLLTAVGNWTGIKTAYGLALSLLFGLWVLARAAFLSGEGFVMVAAGLDMLFSVALMVTVTYPVIKSRQWKQIAVVSKLLVIVVFNACFYLGAINLLDNGVRIGIYGGFYMVIGLILTIGRRVIPFFIERGVTYEVKLINSKWLDLSSLFLFLGFFVAEVLLQSVLFTSILALCLLIVNGVRLVGWHTPGIWRNPMLWSLYLAMWFICLGFLLLALVGFAGISKYLAIHAFAFGGIGLVTMGMMARVSLGHTGRSVLSAPRAANFSLLMILLGAIVRVFFPLFDEDHYAWWIVASQILWIAAFMIFLLTYFPVLIRPRVDGK